MFGNAQFDAVSKVEVIEHLENPRHIFRQIKSLLNRGGVVLLTTPNASGLYSRLRFFFTGQMAMFTDAAYAIGQGHITPLTAWQLEKIFSENGMKALERRFHDAPFFPPRSSGDIAKVIAWLAFRPFMFGTVGGKLFSMLSKMRTDTVCRVARTMRSNFQLAACGRPQTKLGNAAEAALRFRTLKVLLSEQASGADFTQH
jgi:SAM-dependent methyltransferase